jgi:SAM-dependent methyltransferase
MIQKQCVTHAYRFPHCFSEVGVGGLEPPTSASQTQRASNCATPRRREYNAKYTHPSRRIRLFPALYHAHHRQYQDDLLFWLNLADRYRDPILELSCGTGRVLIPLARAGYRIFGLDNDPAMLAYLQANIEPNLKHRTRIFEGDLTRFHLTEQFSLILLPCNTYSTLDTTERKSTLQCVHAHLCGGGIFAVSVPNPLLLADLPPGDEAQVETVFEHPDSGLPVQVSSAWETTNDAVTFIWHYDHLLTDGTVHRLTASTRHHLISEKTYRSEFSKMNLAVIAAFGDFDSSAFESDSPYLILVAQKLPIAPK